jgi:hypothetical protein
VAYIPYITAYLNIKVIFLWAPKSTLGVPKSTQGEIRTANPTLSGNAKRFNL